MTEYVFYVSLQIRFFLKLVVVNDSIPFTAARRKFRLRAQATIQPYHQERPHVLRIHRIW
ncbi:hypothetical protein KL86DPRO_11049 [uncultured delta proteobacterium]|uniref:Uncharacterized protein n=1 Tax=uncultured delta proteobacterium TaxID=34034 RepID=A0A212JAQ0_9DELT|nr:hypothetical protein KL86DPRO_11049 [uncultured delta proteobacterium]